MIRDAVIIDVEFKMESDYSEYGHFICLRFVDESPSLIKLSSFIRELSQFNDVKITYDSSFRDARSYKVDFSKFENIGFKISIRIIRS